LWVLLVMLPDLDLAIERVLPIFSMAQGTILALSVIFMRIGIIAFFVPGIGERFLSPRIRLASAFAITFLVFPAIELPVGLSLTLLEPYTLALCAEIVNGLFFGFLIRVFIFALQIFGTVVSQNLSLAQLFSPQFSADAETPFGTISVFAAIAIALALGLHVKLVLALIGCFEIQSAGTFPETARLASVFVQQVETAFNLAIQLSMPFIITGLTYNLIIGAANRAMPQMLASLVGAPAISLMGLVIFTICLPVILMTWERELTALLKFFAGGANG